jgi:branched-chain amino acid transport system substrate-binding protein
MPAGSVRLQTCVLAALALLAVATWGSADPEKPAPRQAQGGVSLTSASSVEPSNPRGALGVEPFFKNRSVTAAYLGPGREDPEPAAVSEVLVGWFAPSDPNDPEGGDAWLGASLAIDEANEAGGYRGAPFRLRPCWSGSPWSQGAGELARMVYSEPVWVVIGSASGEATHLAEQVAVKAGVPLVSPVSTDKTVNLANVPWVFSLVPGDHRQAPLLVERLLTATAGRPFVLLSATNHDARLATEELLAALRRQQATPALHLAFAPGPAGSDSLAREMENVRATSPAAFLVVAGALDSARAVKLLRAQAFGEPIFGVAPMGRSCFLGEAGGAAQGVTFPLLFDPGGSDPAPEFARRFAARFGHQPDYAAAHAYDATCLVVAAVRQAGLNRARIRDALQTLPPWQGVTGTVSWDPTGQNDRPILLGTIAEGRIIPSPQGAGARTASR